MYIKTSIYAPESVRKQQGQYGIKSGLLRLAFSLASLVIYNNYIFCYQKKNNTRVHVSCSRGMDINCQSYRVSSLLLWNILQTLSKKHNNWNIGKGGDIRRQ